MNRAIITPVRKPLRGVLYLPGDKSISHRRALLSLLTGDDVVMDGINDGDDVRASLDCLIRLGKSVSIQGARTIISGMANWASCELDCRNSGTTARLLMGLLAGQEGEWIIVGDESLSRRPMERAAEPLRRMGARIDTTAGSLPVRIRGSKLRAIQYESPVSSAQVKTAVLLAGLAATGETRFREPTPSRDHTERMLRLDKDTDGWMSIHHDLSLINGERLSGPIPADASAAAFWTVAALTIADSEIRMPGVLANPLRTEYVRILKAVGGRIDVGRLAPYGGEETCVLNVYGSRLEGFAVDKESIPSLIDEIPILAVAAACARGTSRFMGLNELRTKESDRVAGIVSSLGRLGVRIAGGSESIEIQGPALIRGAELQTGRDHRLAMTFAVAGLGAAGETTILDPDCVSVSYPLFWNDLERFTSISYA